MKRSLIAWLCGAVATTAWGGWSSPEEISPPGPKWRLAFNFATALVATSDGGLHAVFFKDEGGAAIYRRYDPVTRSWDSPFVLETNDGRDACLLVDADGRLHAFFRGGGGRLGHRIGDAAGHWGPPEYFYPGGYSGAFPSPALLPAGDVAVACIGDESPTRPQIYYSTWRRATQTFDPWFKVSDATGTGAWMPTVASFQDKVRCVYRDDSPGNVEIYERVFDGVTWGPIRRLTYDPAASFHPRLFVDGAGVLHLVFMDRRGGLAKLWEFKDAGGGWDTEKVIYGGPAESYHPNVTAAPDGRTIMVWEDTRYNTFCQVTYGVYEPENGWSPERRVSYNNKDHAGPSVAVTAGGEVAVVYCEGGDRVLVQRLPLNEVPVGGVTLRAFRRGDAVVLTWEDPGVARYQGFNLFRGDSTGKEWERINAALIEGRSPFVFVDDAAPSGGARYKLMGTRVGAEDILAETAVPAANAGKGAFDVKAYPNPARGAVTLTWTQPTAGAAAVLIYDLRGAVVVREKVEAREGRNSRRLDLSALPPGLYLATLDDGRAAAGAKVVITR